MQPFFEPMAGEVTGVTTAILQAKHGAITARACKDASLQLIAFGKDVVFTSTYWPDGPSIVGGDVWLPWTHQPCHDVARLARHLDVDLEIAESAETLTGVVAPAEESKPAETRHPYASYWDRGVRNVPDMTGAKHLLDGRDFVAIFAALEMPERLANVLDVGCGTGRLAQFCNGYVGVDIAPSMVEYCEARGLVTQLTVTPDDFPVGPFTWATAISVCTHIDRAERQRLLARLAAIADNLLIDIIPGDESGNVAYWTAVPADFEADLQAAGWRIFGQYDHSWDAAPHRYYRAVRA